MGQNTCKTFCEVGILFRRRVGLGLLVAVLVMWIGFFGQERLAWGSPAGGTVLHRVIKGQSLWSIAGMYDTTVKELVAWNAIKDPGKVYPGQIIQVRSSPEIASHKERELLARVIYAEARGEDFDGQVAVGAVVLNRLKHPGFPKTIREVVYQEGAFTATADRQIRLEPDESAWEAAAAALAGKDPTGGALFYYNPAIAKDRWIKTRPVITVIGNHVFSS